MTSVVNNHELLMSKLPEQWRRLFELLSVDRYGDKLSQAWYKREGEATKRTWESLLQAVVQLEPTIEGECLNFYPLLVCLQENVAKEFMKFLLKQQYNVSADSLHHFIRTMMIHLPPSHWCVPKCTKLFKSLAKRKVEIDQQAAQSWGDGEDTLDGCAVLLKGSEEKDSNEEIQHDKQLSLALDCNQGLKDIIMKAHSISWTDKLIASDGTKAAVKSLRNMPFTLMEDNKTKQKECSAKQEWEKEESCSQNNKAANKLNPRDGLRRSTLAEHNGDILCIESQIQKVREAWLTGQKQMPAEVQTLAMIPSSQMETVCQLLGLSDLSEMSLLVAADHVSSLAEMLSEQSSITLIRGMIENKFAQLITPSRLFTTCLTTLAAAFPKELTSILCLCLSLHSSSIGQAETVASLCKTAFDKRTLSYFIREFCQSKVPVEENTLIMAQSIIDQHPELDSSFIAAMLVWLEATAIQNAQSAKYGRLVLCLVKTYRAQLGTCHLASLRGIVDAHKSVIRRSLQQLLKSLN